MEPGEKKKADERRGDAGGNNRLQEEIPQGQVRDIVADEAGIGSGRTYYNLHKVMMAAGEGYEIVEEDGQNY